jgi:hypothetical protein
VTADRDDATRLAAQVHETLGTAIEVLGHLERSLERAGFGAGAAAYQSMSQVLIGQRLWAQSTPAGAALQPRFAEVAAHARAIHALLAPYADAMLRLGALVPAADEPAPAPADEPRARVLHALRAGPASLSALKSQLGLGGAELKPLLDALCAAGTITHRRTSGRDIYTLAPGG